MTILDHRTIKFQCLQAYCLTQLEYAEKSTKDGKGRKCINTDHVSIDEIADACEAIAKEIKSNGNTHNSLSILGARLSYVKPYYDCIGQTVKKHFEKGDPWIPALLVLSVLQEYTLRGHKGFEAFNFTDLLSGFEGVEENNTAQHYKCAFDVVERLANIKISKKKSKKRK